MFYFTKEAYIFRAYLPCCMALAACCHGSWATLSVFVGCYLFALSLPAKGFHVAAPYLFPGGVPLYGFFMQKGCGLRLVPTSIELHVHAPRRLPAPLQEF